MSHIPLSTYVSFALSELFDASDNLESILSRLDDDLAKDIVLDISKDIHRAIDKLQNISL